MRSSKSLAPFTLAFAAVTVKTSFPLDFSNKWNVEMPAVACTFLSNSNSNLALFKFSSKGWVNRTTDLALGLSMPTIRLKQVRSDVNRLELLAVAQMM